MKNEIGRKITSLTLMTIMVAGGMTFAIPGVLPDAFASHNANLFVSAENSAYDNYFSGPMVIEVVVNDPDIKTLDDAHGEPDVTVNGAILRMVQTTDGNWYGYFSDRSQAQIGDATQQAATLGNSNGTGLNFGIFCDNNDGVIGIDLGDSKGFAIPITGEVVGGTDQDGTIEGAAACTVDVNSGSENFTTANVIRESKTPVTGTATVLEGQLGIDINLWPFIQLYDFSVGGNVIVQYNKGGGAQSTTLTFDTVDQYSGVELDRPFYPLGSEIHITLTDLQLNIDPTDEDTWTFGGVDQQLIYNIFDESGNNAGAFTDGTFTVFNDAAAQDISGNRTALLFEVNGVIFIALAQDGPVVAELADNDDQIFNAVLEAAVANPITFTELGVNTGVFGNYDETDNSNFNTLSEEDAAGVNTVRGRSALFEYGEIENSIVIGFGFATIDLVADSVDGQWNSGEGISLILVDEDANKNTRADEDLDLNNPLVDLIPSMTVGAPFSLEQGDTTTFFNTLNIFDAAAASTFFRDSVGGQELFGDSIDTVQSFSQRLVIDPDGIIDLDMATDPTEMSALFIDLNDRTVGDLTDVIFDARAGNADNFRGFNQFHYDLRSIDDRIQEDDPDTPTARVDTVNIYLVIATTDGQDLTAASINDATLPDDTVKALLIARDAGIRGTIQLSTDFEGDSAGFYAALFGDNDIDDADEIGLVFFLDDADTDFLNVNDDSLMPIVADFFSTGLLGDGLLTSERINNQIIRIELEETGDNTSTFRGWIEYTMLSQINIFDLTTYTTLFPVDDYAEFLVSEDFTDEDSLRVRYNDLGSDGVITPVADQQEAPTHSGVVSFDSSTYKVADTVIVTLSDADLNKDVDIIDIYTTVDPVAEVGDPVVDRVGVEGLGLYADGSPFGTLVFITFNDALWTQQPAGSVCNDLIIVAGAAFNQGLFETGFTLIETGTDTGEFTGTFQVPNVYCEAAGDEELSSTTGTDIEVNYLDFRDASGEVIEVGDSAGIRANTGSVSLDRTVYPVPFGSVADFTIGATQTDPAGDSVFVIHATGIAGATIDGAGLALPTGDLQIHIRINDPDFDISAAGEDTIGGTLTAENGPVEITVSRGSNSILLATAGGPNGGGDVITVLNGTVNGVIGIGTTLPQPGGDGTETIDLGPINEIAPDAGIFEIDMTIRYTDGPSSALCPTTDSFAGLNGTARSTNPAVRFSDGERDHCILQGDIITVQYTDPTDASGEPNTVTDSATFDLRNGVLQSDKSVYIIGSDLIMTLIEPDFDLDNDAAETYDLDLIEWDSDAATVTMGDIGAQEFDPEPSDFRETGDSTGIFQIVIEIPEELIGDRLERGEQIVLEYTDWGPSGADHVGDEDEDINLTIFTSNFGATVELDQKVYSWTDKVYITIIAPDHNFDSDLIDEIGESALDPIKVSTRGNNLDRYKLVETGTDTGIFTGEVILTGFTHDADGDIGTGDEDGFDAPTQTPPTSADEGGPTDGFLASDDDDGITVAFEFSEDETVIGSALIRWNIGEVQWLEASYPASGTGVVRIIDPDMNLNPEAVDNFDVDVWSDSDAGGIDLTVTETNEATGIFEGTVFFTTTDESSGHRLRVAEGDTITAEYDDNTLPDPYTTADELDIAGTSLIGTIVPPLERAPAANARVVDAFGNALASVSVDQQVQITADLANGQDRDQSFAYLVQVQDGNGVTVSLAWITGSLAPGQSFSPALSWTPDAAGTYTATVFVWESVDNPTALSPPTSVDIDVS